MAHAAGLRATSFAASIALLGGATIAALSMTITLTRDDFRTPPIIPMVAERPDPPPRPSTPLRPVSEAPAISPIVMPQATPLPLETAAPSLMGASTVDRPMIVDPHWLRRPRDLARYYPRRAVERGIEGEVVLDCLVTVDGALACAVISEAPVNWGLGEAALRIARDHRMAPALREGIAVEGRYRMRVPFQLE
jgi:protein TonB